MGKIKYDFVEVGTSDFHTVVEISSPWSKGISIEPLAFYLDKLPVLPECHKEYAALVTEEMFANADNIEVYYVPEDTIWKHNLGDWVKGCNSVGKPHDFHTHYFPDPGRWHNELHRDLLPTRNILEEGLVRHEVVKCITWAQLVEKYDIEQVGLLKTDTEGLDAALLIDVINYYKKNDLLDKLPIKIKFEDNAHTNQELMVIAKNLMREVGYVVNDERHLVHDSYAELKRGL
jgi:hypothetical protein